MYLLITFFKIIFLSFVLNNKKTARLFPYKENNRAVLLAIGYESSLSL